MEDRSNESYRLLVDTILTPIVVANIHMEILDANPFAHRLFEYEPGELIGKTAKILMPKDIQRKHDSFVENYVKGGAPKIIGIPSRQVVGVTKTGKELQLLLSLAENKEKGVFIASFQDITKVLAQEKALQELERRKDVEATNFLAHQLKNRFISINLLTQNLSSELKSTDPSIFEKSEKINCYINDLRVQAKRGFRICMLEQVSRQIIYDEYVPNIESIDLAVTLKELCGSQYPVHIDERLPKSVCTDVNILFHILENFLSNASKYGGKSFPPRLEVKAEEDKIIFSVVNAPGLDHDLCMGLDTTNLFDRGVTLAKVSDSIHEKSASRSQSNGNGLYIVRKCSDAIEADVSLVFHNDKVVAMLKMPCKPGKTDEDANEASGSKNMSDLNENSKLSSSTVLAALDDDEVSRMIYRQMFKKLAVNPISFDMIQGQSKEEIEGFEDWLLNLRDSNKQPDLVLIDEHLDMPGSFCSFMKGSEIVKNLRRRGYSNKLVIRSANDTSKDVVRYMELGADGFIGKNVRNTSDLAKEIANVLRNQHLDVYESKSF